MKKLTKISQKRNEINSQAKIIFSTTMKKMSFKKNPRGNKISTQPISQYYKFLHSF